MREMQPGQSVEQPKSKKDRNTDGEKERCEDCLLIVRRFQTTRPPTEVHITVTTTEEAYWLA